MEQRPKRRCVARRSALPSAAHYVGYVEDDETPEMIMRKFEEMERLLAARRKQTESDAATGSQVPREVSHGSLTAAHAGDSHARSAVGVHGIGHATPAAADLHATAGLPQQIQPTQQACVPSHAPSASAARASTASAADATQSAPDAARHPSGAQTALQPQQQEAHGAAACPHAQALGGSAAGSEQPQGVTSSEDGVLDESLLLEVFKATSIYSVKSALAHNAPLMVGSGPQGSTVTTRTRSGVGASTQQQQGGSLGAPPRPHPFTYVSGAHRGAGASGSGSGQEQDDGTTGEVWGQWSDEDDWNDGGTCDVSEGWDSELCEQLRGFWEDEEDEAMLMGSSRGHGEQAGAGKDGDNGSGDEDGWGGGKSSRGARRCGGGRARRAGGGSRTQGPFPWLHGGLMPEPHGGTSYEPSNSSYMGRGAVGAAAAGSTGAPGGHVSGSQVSQAVDVWDVKNRVWRRARAPPGWCDAHSWLGMPPALVRSVCGRNAQQACAGTVSQRAVQQQALQQQAEQPQVVQSQPCKGATAPSGQPQTVAGGASWDSAATHVTSDGTAQMGMPQAASAPSFSQSVTPSASQTQTVSQTQQPLPQQAPVRLQSDTGTPATQPAASAQRPIKIKIKVRSAPTAPTLLPPARPAGSLQPPPQPPGQPPQPPQPPIHQSLQPTPLPRPPQPPLPPRPPHQQPTPQHPAAPMASNSSLPGQQPHTSTPSQPQPISYKPRSASAPGPIPPLPHPSPETAVMIHTPDVTTYNFTRLLHARHCTPFELVVINPGWEQQVQKLGENSNELNGAPLQGAHQLQGAAATQAAQLLAQQRRQQAKQGPQTKGHGDNSDDSDEDEEEIDITPRSVGTSCGPWLPPA